MVFFDINSYIRLTVRTALADWDIFKYLNIEKCGKNILENFLVKIAKVAQTWTPAAFVETTVSELKEKLCKIWTIIDLKKQS